MLCVIMHKNMLHVINNTRSLKTIKQGRKWNLNVHIIKDVKRVRSYGVQTPALGLAVSWSLSCLCFDRAYEGKRLAVQAVLIKTCARSTFATIPLRSLSCCSLLHPMQLKLANMVNVGRSYHVCLVGSWCVDQCQFSPTAIQLLCKVMPVMPVIPW